MAMRLIPLHSSHDRPDLASALIRRGVRLGSAHGGSATVAVPGPLEPVSCGRGRSDPDVRFHATFSCKDWFPLPPT